MLRNNYNIDYYDMHRIVCDCDYTRHNMRVTITSVRVCSSKLSYIHASRIKDFDKYLCSRLWHNSIMGHFAVRDYAHYRFHEGLEIDKKKTKQNRNTYGSWLTAKIK